MGARNDATSLPTQAIRFRTVPTVATTYGFIGLGHQGTPMAERMIDAGLRPWLWARRREVVDRYTDAATNLTATPAELAARCDVIGLCLYDGEATDSVVFGADGMIEGLRPGATIAMHATVGPAYVRDLADRLVEHDVGVVDAPVSGGEAAAAGQLLVMAAGDDDQIDRCQPMFDAYAKLVVRLGRVGAAQSAKLINNGLMASIAGLVMDAFDLGDALDVDSDGLAEVLANGSAATPSVGFVHAIGAEQFSIRGWPTLHKDVALVTALVGDVDRDDMSASVVDAAQATIADMERRRADWVHERESE